MPHLISCDIQNNDDLVIEDPCRILYHIKGDKKKMIIVISNNLLNINNLKILNVILVTSLSKMIYHFLNYQDLNTLLIFKSKFLF